MARPTKATVDYFPHDTKHGKTIFILKSKYGNDGYAAWFQILEILGHTEGHSFDCSAAENQEYLSAYLLIDWQKCCAILDTLATLGAIDGELWKQKVIWSDNFLARILEAYKKRTALPPDKPTINPVSDSGNPVSDSGNPQSKVKKTKKEKIFVPDPIGIGLAEFFLGLLDQRNYAWPINKKTGIVKRPNLQAWAAGFDEIIRLDGREPQDIEKVLRWCQTDSFWRNNILSPAKLRIQWAQLELKMRASQTTFVPGYGQIGVEPDGSTFS